MSQEINARTLALEHGFRYYRSTPCKKGHTMRYATNGTCVECTRMRNKKRKKVNKETGHPANTADNMPISIKFMCMPW